MGCNGPVETLFFGPRLARLVAGVVLGHSGNKRLPSPATNTASITIRPRPVHLLVTASQPANDLAAILDDGDVALGVLDNTYSPTLVEFYGELGVDFVWLDFEHGGPDPWDGGQLEDLLAPANERTWSYSSGFPIPTRRSSGKRWTSARETCSSRA